MQHWRLARALPATEKSLRIFLHEKFITHTFLRASRKILPLKRGQTTTDVNSHLLTSTKRKHDFSKGERRRAKESEENVESVETKYEPRTRDSIQGWTIGQVFVDYDGDTDVLPVEILSANTKENASGLAHIRAAAAAVSSLLLVARERISS